MKNAFAIALSFICAATFVAAQAAPAQEKPAAPAVQQPSTPAPSSASAAGKVTYVGCLKPGTAADTWTLENAEKAATASASASSSTATTAATAGGGAKTTLALTVKPSENIKPHANHKIEVTGTVSAASPSGGAAGAGAAAAAPRQNLNVESVKMVSATCP